MIECGDGLGFLFEAAKAIRIVIERFRQNLQSDFAPEPGIASTVDLAHAARTQGRLNGVRADLCARCQGHEVPGIIAEIPDTILS
jgi:hypothetical protein